MRLKRVILGFFAVYAVVAAIAYSTSLVPESSRSLVQNTLFLIAPLFSALIGLYVLKNQDIRSDRGKTLLFIVLGFAMWLVGELIWVVYESVLGQKPFPSVADFFYLAAYPLFIAGIFNELKLGKIDWTKKKIAISILIALLLASITSYYGIYSAYDSSVSLFENVLSMAYGVADLVIIISLIFLINLSLEFSGGSLASSWVVFAMGMLFYWFADVANAIYYDQYEAFVWAFRQIDYLWIAGYFLLGYALFMQKESVDRLNDALLAKMKTLSGKPKARK